MNKLGTLIKSTADAADIDLINSYTRRKFDTSEIYSFSLVLCYNEIDRDFERFTNESLQKLAELFTGKTGIFDHSPKGTNQTARIFKTEVITDDARKTSYGEPYTYLKAGAYMVRSDKNADLITDIDAGIKKEVSVGCSVKKAVCSICGTDLKISHCKHVKGKRYNTQLCHIILQQPDDAYEWSFVAVPAQKAAGVIKNHNKAKGKIKDMEEITLSKAEYDTLQSLAQQGQTYKTLLETEVVKSAFLSGSNISGDVMESVVKKLSIDELLAFKKSYAKAAPKSQLDVTETDEKNSYNQFKI